MGTRAHNSNHAAPWACNRGARQLPCPSGFSIADRGAGAIHTADSAAAGGSQAASWRGQVLRFRAQPPERVPALWS